MALFLPVMSVVDRAVCWQRVHSVLRRCERGARSRLCRSAAPPLGSAVGASGWVMPPWPGRAKGCPSRCGSSAAPRKSRRPWVAAGPGWSGIAGRSGCCRACSSGRGTADPGAGLPRVRADRFGAEAVHVAFLDQPGHHVRVRPGECAPSSFMFRYSAGLARLDQSVRISRSAPGCGCFASHRLTKSIVSRKSGCRAPRPNSRSRRRWR